MIMQATQIDVAAVHAIVNETIRGHINTCGNHFGSVLYIKKDGTPRRLTFNVAAGPKRVRGTELGQRMRATRAANHPNLLPIWDVHKAGWRSINLDTVLTVQAGGKLTRYRQARQLGPGVYELVAALTVRAGVPEPVNGPHKVTFR